MVLTPQVSTVTVTVHPGKLLGLTLCQVSNSVNGIVPGLIDELNRRFPGSIEVGDRIMKVNGEEGKAFLLIRAFAMSLTDGPKRLHLTVLRPVEFDVAIDVATQGQLGLEIMDAGFVQRVAQGGMIDAHNLAQERLGLPCLREGDRVTEVSGRAPATEDGAAGNVLPYLRLAMCGGASPLQLHVRRGDYVPVLEDLRRVESVATAKETEEASKARSGASTGSCFSSVLPSASGTRAWRSAGSALSRAAERLLSRPSKNRQQVETTSVQVKASSKQTARMDSKQSKAGDEPSTPSTRGPTSSCQWSDSSDTEREDFISAGRAGHLTLPGIIQRVHA
jgi:hypothetical protein